MMITDDMLMAYADGELDAAQAAAVEAALAQDAALAAKVAQHKATRAAVSGAYAPVLDEDVPDRLSAMLKPPAQVLDLAQARKQREKPKAPAQKSKLGAREWGALAACVVGGLIVGQAMLPRDGSLIRPRGDVLAAAGVLDRALTTHEAGLKSGVRIGLSFKAKDGAYCRTFAVEKSGMIGLACRERGDWQMRALAQSNAGGGEYRMAGADAPEILAAVDRMIEGEPLDAEAETRALKARWK